MPGWIAPALSARSGDRFHRPAGAAGTGQVRRLLAADGTVVRAEHLRPRDHRSGDGLDDLAIVVVHGFTQHSRTPRMRRIASWLTASAGVVLVDLRGHGGSAGQSTVGRHEVLDVDAAVRWARALGYRRVATVGFSLGSAVVLRQAALYGGVDAVAAVSGPAHWYYRGTANMRAVHRLVLTRGGRALLRLVRHTKVSPTDWTPPYPMDPQAAAAELDVPVLVVHGDRDDFFPVHHAWQVYSAARRGTLWLEPGFGHAESALTEQLAGRIADWVDEHAVPVAASTDGG